MYGANLVSISSSTEQNDVEGLIQLESDNFWTGLSDTVSTKSSL